jgi:hypothetical protein
MPLLPRFHSTGQAGAETGRPVTADGWGKGGSHGFNILAVVLLGILWAATPTKAIFTVTYNGTVAHNRNGTVSNPNGVAVDLSGNLYIADTGSNQSPDAPL